MQSALEIAMQSWVGRVIAERYMLERVLGSGGCGAVFKARHVVTQRRIALKVIPCVELEDGAVQRFRLEASAPATINHPSLVDVYDAGYDPSGPCLYVAQELLHGRDLRAELEARGNLPWQEAVALLVPAMAAVTAAHRAGVLQRDIKPENLFLSLDRGVITTKVLDWGVALAPQKKTRVTTEGSVVGTPWYLAPEIVGTSHNASVQSDVWAMACVLFECIYGNTPFDGETCTDVMASVLTAPIPRIDTLVPEVPAAVADVIAKGLTRDKAERWHSMAAMLGALIEASGLEWNEPRDFEEQETVVRTGKSRETTEGVTTQVRIKVRQWPQNNVSPILKFVSVFVFTASMFIVATSGARRTATTHAAVASRPLPPSPPVKTVVLRPAVIQIPPLPPEAYASPPQPHPRPRPRPVTTHDAGHTETTPLRNGAPVFEP